MKKPNTTNRSLQRGATLIEALISILIMSIGLLGIASMQLSAISYQKSSWSMHKIAELSIDIAERIRANPTGARNSNYIYNESYATAKSATPTNNNCKALSTFCSTAQIAADDVAAFITRAQKLLPEGAAVIEGDFNNGYVATAMYYDKEFINSSGILQTSATCSATTSGIDWRNCCPATASVPNGVRCRRINIIP